MIKLPPPGTFAEGQRLAFGWLAALAGMFCGLMSLAMICLLMWGRWSPTEEHTIVIIFGCSLGGYIAAMICVIIGLLVGGPVGRFKGEANILNKASVSWEADGPEQPSNPAQVTINTEAKQ